MAAPPPTVGDVARTARVVVTDLLPMLAAMALGRAVSSTTEEGLALIRRVFSGTLRRLGVRVEVAGAESVPREGGVVFLWNQESHLDEIVLPCVLPRPFFSLYNNEVARIPWYGGRLRATGHVHVDRNDEGQWRPAIARAAERVRAGECVLVSPEGTRSPDGRLLPMKRGAMLLAEASDRPLVCVTVIGGHERLPRGSPIVRSGPVRAVFSEPLACARDAASIAAAVVRTFEQTKRDQSGVTTGVPSASASRTTVESPSRSEP
jgi:1-acyl-sn-glycerol-3-phosphate acyltransferase